MSGRVGEFLKYHGKRAALVVAPPVVAAIGTTSTRLAQGARPGEAVLEGLGAGGAVLTAETVGAAIDRRLRRTKPA